MSGQLRVHRKTLAAIATTCAACCEPSAASQDRVGGNGTSTALALTSPRAVIATGGAATVAPPSPPEALACIATYFGGAPRFAEGHWGLQFSDGPMLLFEDGRAKSLQERLAAPDLEDMLSSAYPLGRVVPVDIPNGDPGRVRVEALFNAAYGSTEAEVRRELVIVKILDKPFFVHRKVAPALQHVGEGLLELVRAEPTVASFFEHPAGGFKYRHIQGTERLSGHAYGIAVDLDADKSAYHGWDHGKLRWRNSLPPSLIELFESEGFIWGGRWYHYDTMHFEYRPELFDPRCRGAQRVGVRGEE